ncbi:ATP-binding cassette domain-containing protein [Cellulomonas sp. JZ18]|uniref:ATP-binding cassette domain-containing protein n=1 Tax=Cellulomonas sp. JZ18 TaxID=2654191 RepID=UPI0012D37281|nr:ABC transporter ATP-binding protein [Cellulomonas sp. JZ18]QGQ18430.1 ATP-binding cassette domain-containing protein [Cellulomonas sp. JZ18]
MSLLEVDGLTVRTSDGHTLLDGVTWDVAAGARLGIIGESGSGKSMTALAVLGLLPAGMRATGHVRLDGTDLLALPPRRMDAVRGAQVAMVFQEPLTALDPLMTVGRQITGPVRLHQRLSRTAAREEAARLLRLVQIDDTERVLGSYPWQLSGGQRQRVSLAMALACRPRVLLADEPTTALDVTVQAEVLELLDDVVERTGLALVLVTHDLPVVARVAQDLVVMRDGAVVERTTVPRALAGDGAAYTRELVDAARAVTALPTPEAR